MVPLVLYFHLALEKRSVAAIFHGHHHATDHDTWAGAFEKRMPIAR